jgi:lipopolysaccharide/colanic/teichoic acid biosynthesis glycosyltransferase
MIIATWMGLKRLEQSNRGADSWVLPGGPDGRLFRPGIGVRVGRAAPRFHVGPLQEAPGTEPVNRWEELVRRNLNVTASAILIVMTAPIMILIALAVKLTSPGPVFFTQPRVGVDRRDDDPNLPRDPRRKVDHGGRIFEIYKFRTMTHQPASTEVQIWASPEDPRITMVGRFLRRYRLDELPQLFNVLKGDMNLVGPRPEQPDIFKALRHEIEGYQARQRVLPGITGLAQVNHRYDQSVEDVRQKVELDLAYVEHVTPLEDLRIMAQTVPVVLFGKGAI